MAFARLTSRMRSPSFAPIAAVTAVLGGAALLGSSLGGIASVDRELAAVAPGSAVPGPVTREGGPQARFAAARWTAPLRYEREERVRVISLGEGYVLVLREQVTPARPDASGRTV